MCTLLSPTFLLTQEDEVLTTQSAKLKTCQASPARASLLSRVQCVCHAAWLSVACMGPAARRLVGFPLPRS